ncbi:hypothetical protein NLM27_14100 [Bradyrhizobium sp. CCGB12]|nr:hypothetical protein [Bradyrhizobium sp. CCGB12]MCP3389907.1 hypothetical protein [Bradyrhizobium sp. CCGB12]
MSTRKIVLAVVGFAAAAALVAAHAIVRRHAPRYAATKKPRTMPGL